MMPEIDLNNLPEWVSIEHDTQNDMSLVRTTMPNSQRHLIAVGPFIVVVGNYQMSLVGQRLLPIELGRYAFGLMVAAKIIEQEREKVK